MLARVQSSACLGIHAYPVQVEVDVSNGLPQFIVVGLPDTSIKESRERVRAAIKNSGYAFPPEKITLNLAPADIKKEGPAYDLPIALGILAATGLISEEKLGRTIFLGELALDGSLRPFKGAVAIASGKWEPGQCFVFPEENAKEAAFENGMPIYPVRHLSDVIQWLRGEQTLEPLNPAAYRLPFETSSSVDFSEVRGQNFAKRALEVAVAGNHNILLIGPPGAGKSMLARRIPTILPPLHFEEALEITKIYSVAGLSTGGSLIGERPFRTPHASVSPVALLGGGSIPRPGEISLAHGGVLFLDEFPEFRRDVIDSLRSPMEDGEIMISRARMGMTYPSRFLLVAAMNPCPCGHLGDRAKNCRCSLPQIHKYQNRISGPILDRIDLHVEVPAISFQALTSETPAESSAGILERVLKARRIQTDRYAGRPFRTNGLMKPKELKQFARLGPEARKLVEMAMKELHLSARAYYKLLKISRTLADLEDSEEITAPHVAEAIQYRSLDRKTA